jgi:sodium transport system permease protein
MKSMWVVFSKEFIDIIRDRRRFFITILTTFIFLPLLFILPYAYLFTRAIEQQMDVLTIPVKGMDHAPELIAYLSKEENIQAIDAENVQTLVKDRDYSVGLIIPEDYQERIDGGHSAELILVTDMRRTLSLRSNRLRDALNAYESQIVQARLEERGINEDYVTPLIVKQQNAVTSTETAGSMLGLFIPGIIISIGLTAGMPIAVSSIAGEKKKLTLEPVLFTTVSRFQLVLAMMLAVFVSILLTLIGLGIATLVYGGIALLIMIRSLPIDRIMSASGAAADSSIMEMLSDVYQVQPLAIFLFVLAPFLIILMGAAFQILVSTWARNDEEATTYLTPISLLSGLVFMLAFFLDEFIPRLWHYAIPIFGTIIAMRDLLSNKLEPASLAIMFTTSALYATLMLILAVWMFHREEVVFRT